MKDLSNLIYNKDSILFLACPASNLGALFKSTVKRMVQASLNVLALLKVAITIPCYHLKLGIITNEQWRS